MDVGSYAELRITIGLAGSSDENTARRCERLRANVAAGVRLNQQDMVSALLMPR
jgi:hypothetical protein